jgi:hypothetical protein
MIRRRLSHRTRSPFVLVAVLFLSLGSLSLSPAAAQTELPNATIDILSVTCEGLVTFTYTSDQAITVAFQFSHTRVRPEHPNLLGSASVDVPATSTPQTLQAQGDPYIPIAEANDPIATALYWPQGLEGGAALEATQYGEVFPFPDDCGGGTEPPPTAPEPSGYEALVAQLVALLIAILTSLLG